MLREFTAAACAGATALLGLVVAAHAQAIGDPNSGAMVFQQQCSMCHSIGIDAKNGVGPVLNGIIGRKAAEMADYRYSRALRRSGITWTAEALDTFIADPQASVPANRMPYAGMPDAADRADLITYLQRVSKSSAP